jgi:hypothetical protein
MKQLKYGMIAFIGMLSLLPSCVDDLLNRNATTQLSSEIYWRDANDALYITMGVYEATRTLHGRDYYFDGLGEFQFTRGTSLGSGTWNTLSSFGSNFGYMWNNAYRVIDRANFVITNLEPMIENETVAATKQQLERLNGENHFLRALAYFRLIELWGDVPFFTHVLNGNEEAITLPRTPIAEIKDQILADLTYAISVLPTTLPASERGRATQIAAYGFRGKVALYWACWKKNGWDELTGFTKDESEANKYFQDAANDFKQVIDGYGLKLYADGNPGTYENPAYWELFNATSTEYAPEIIFSVQYGGPNLQQGEELLRDFGTRNTGNAQCWVIPTHRLADRYQSLTTGDFVAPLILSSDATLPGGSCNPASYENRDWRMKATILWDGQTLLTISTDGMVLGGPLPFKFGSSDGVNFINYDASNSPGYLFRKWVRQWGGAERSQGPQDMYLMRLADVYLMYCEAMNELSGPSQELVALVNAIRSRGNLPGLAPEKYAGKEAFFNAIEQERIVELVAEGHRFFDIRRWRKLEAIWGEPGGPGLTLYNTHGARVRDELKNASTRDFQRYYIFQIPNAERDRNQNLTQNQPWL